MNHKNSNSFCVRHIFNSNQKYNAIVEKLKILCRKIDKERQIFQIFFNYTNTSRRTITLVFNYLKRSLKLQMDKK